MTYNVKSTKTNSKLKLFNAIACSVFKQNSRTIYTHSQVVMTVAAIKKGMKLGKEVTIEQMIENLESTKNLGKLNFHSLVKNIHVMHGTKNRYMTSSQV